jgi:hypothetical protein
MGEIQKSHQLGLIRCSTATVKSGCLSGRIGYSVKAIGIQRGELE